MPARRDILSAAVHDAATAPSPLAQREWTWIVRDDGLELRLPARLVGRDDRELRHVLLGCGAALHHACVSLAAAGIVVAVRRFPPTGDGRVVARVWPVDEQLPRAADRRLHRAMRSTPGLGVPAWAHPEWAVEDVLSATVATGAHLYRVLSEQLDLVTDPAEPSVVFVVHGDSDRRHDWLRAGQALSMAVLTAAADGLTAETIDLTPVADRLRAVVPGHGYPYVALRCLVVSRDAPA